jgi:quercetin dioxygenase-like cupin family protein
VRLHYEEILISKLEVSDMSVRIERLVERPWRGCGLIFALACLLGSAACAQQQKLINCKPASERTQPEGCWIAASQPLGKLAGPVFWTLDVYPTQESADKANTNHGTVVQALGRMWLFTVGAVPALPAQGSRVTQIGPLPVKPEEAYTAQFMEGILEPGSVSRTHVHAGPEAFYTEAGETCLETPEGRQVGRKGTDLVIAEGVPMELVATGSEVRRGIILVLHSSAKPVTTVVADWKSKGLCGGLK